MGTSLKGISRVSVRTRKFFLPGTAIVAAGKTPGSRSHIKSTGGEFNPTYINFILSSAPLPAIFVRETSEGYLEAVGKYSNDLVHSIKHFVLEGETEGVSNLNLNRTEDYNFDIVIFEDEDAEFFYKSNGMI